ncbi:MAG: SpoIID/LytB domain-containing protein [Lachnospiraceae bacterium]|nr:SpoIID/LytB domain-containing protein [Lachnospiraceae bacterium]
MKRRRAGSFDKNRNGNACRPSGAYKWIMLVGGCLLTAGLVLGILSILRVTEKPQAQGEYIERADADLLLRELELGSLLTEQKDAQGQEQKDALEQGAQEQKDAQEQAAQEQGVQEQEETLEQGAQEQKDAQEQAAQEQGMREPEEAQEQAAQQNGEKDYLTYGEYLQILDAIYQKVPELYTKEAYEYDKKQALSTDYAKKHFLLREDFLQVYYSLAGTLVPDKEIRESSFRVLGGESEVLTLSGEPALKGRILAADGAAASMEEAEFYELEFADYEAALYRRVRAVVSLDRVVLVLDTEDAPFELKKAWLSSNTEEGLYVCYKDLMFRFPYNREVFDDFEKIVDVTVSDGGLREVKVYREMVSGKLLGITDDRIELVGAGSYGYAPDIQVYKLYGEKETYALQDLKIGYAFTDFVLDDETIIAALVTREENMENIRVLVKSQDFASDYHEEVTVTAECDFVLFAGEEQTEYPAGETLRFKPGDAAFEKGRVKLVPKNLTGTIRIDSLRRAQGTPSYHGFLELADKEEGIVVINELLLEEYLHAVVPSEMPSSYPMEALKAQAVSARTFAYKNMQRSGIPALGAHVNDSTAYQVYNNITQNERTTLAVRGTQGKVLTYRGALADTYYYSTSCGYSTDLSVWGGNVNVEDSHLRARHLAKEADEMTAADKKGDVLKLREEEAFREMITSVDPSDFEKEQEYYRWTYETVLNVDLLAKRLTERQKARPDQILTKQRDGSFAEQEIGSLGSIQGLEVTKRSEGGAACELTIYGKKQTIRVLSEYNIRYILLNETKQVVTHKGRSADVSSLLPSGFLIVETMGGEEVESLRITGGGYGHGIGMSQNGAKVMGEDGYLFDEILKFFFEGIDVTDADQL